MMDENDKKTLCDLKRKRGVIKAALTRVRTFVDSFDPREQALSLLEFRQEELPAINRKFDDVQSQLELLMLDAPEEAEAERGRFEDDYFSIRSQIQELINLEKSHSNTGLASSSFAPTHIQRTQLAPIPLPKFNGNIQEWSSFFDVFKAMVHNEESYSPAQKFFYLRSCLEGPALDLVRSVPISDGNYEVVIGQLIHRYDNRSLIIQSHIRSMLDCPRMEEAASHTLQTLYSTMCTHVAALKAMGQPVEHWDAWLVTIVVSRLDKGTAHSWQLHQRSSELPKYADLAAFLASRCVALEAAESHVLEISGVQKSTNLKKHAVHTGAKKALLATGVKYTIPCPCCSEQHRLFLCESFKRLALTDRLNLVREAKLCFNCLAPFHSVSSCRSKHGCQRCKQKHNTLIHYEKASSIKSPPVQDDTVEINPPASLQDSSRQLSLPSQGGSRHVFLSTASVLAKDNSGEYRGCRAILDSGSQVNFISKRLATLLQLPRERAHLPVSGIGASNTQSVSRILIKIKSRIGAFEIEVPFYVLPVVVNDLPRCPEPSKGWNIPRELIKYLADPSFDSSGTVDLLIGASIFFDLLEPERIRLEKGSLALQATKFGWVVTGETSTTCLLALGSIGECLEEDWVALQPSEEEPYGSQSKGNRKCLEAQEALAHFMATVKRNSEGRFVLKLPLKSEVFDLGDTLSRAQSRFFNVERKLQRDDNLREEYVKFMDEYLEKGHMQEVIESEVPQRVCYLPHHAIVKPSSLTTKVRVVFDASARSSNGRSLNDILLCGPTIQDDVFTILCRFRKHLYVVIADVEKMYRQVLVAQEDCDLQRIVWRRSPSEEMRSYRLLTVTYGTASASFMATQCLATLAEQFEGEYPKAAKAVKCDFYMDDLMTGGDTEEDCLSLHREISIMMDSAKLPLRKWCSNSVMLRREFERVHEDPVFALEIGDEDAIKSLGLSWKPIADEFRFGAIPSPNRPKLTKRVILAELNRIFDPLGFLSPVLIRGKIFLQQLWQIKANWDSVLPTEIQDKWLKFRGELAELQTLSIPRATRARADDSVEIHGFCDASQDAYGACIYIRSRQSEGRWQVRLLCSKSRVAPMKGSTIPRLELNGAVVLAQLLQKVASAWEIDRYKCHLWTDSTVVLSWLNAQSNRLKVYVSNRVNQILELTNVAQWNYIQTDKNPADLISRGVNAVDICTSKLWWTGPDWLSMTNGLWGRVPRRILEEQEIPEQRPIKLALAGVRYTQELVQHFSTWQRLQRATAWLQRFVKYVRKEPVSRSNYLSVTELQSADTCILRQVQYECFNEELCALESGKDVKANSKLRPLKPFLRNGLILVGGRLENSYLPAPRRHPVVLPASHKVTRLIFEHKHREQLHCGPQALLAEVRRKYWPLKSRVMARSVVARCVKCVRANPKFNAPVMGSLPKERVQIARPFTVTGVDFAGPILIRSGIRRVVGVKAWIAVFVCFSTRAIHLEAVEDLSSSAFLASFRRFTARRGLCSIIYSDNGTNFVGARKELDVHVRSAQPQIAQDGIEWRFIPPSAPHFGGLWESAVKSAKRHLTRMMGDAKLSAGELMTLLCQIEACLNSRPLTPMSSDPSEPEVLTPAHFLIGGPISLPSEEDLSQEPVSSLRRWKYVQALMQHFWRRWSSEYLPQLQIRGKWTTNKAPLKIGDIVIIKDECTPPTRWKLGKVVQTHPGKDGAVRVVTVRLGSGTELKRPTVKLCLLPTEVDPTLVETLGFQRGENVAAKQ